MVYAPGELLEVAVGGFEDQARDKEVGEGAMDVHAALLPGWCSAKDANDGHSFHRRGAELGETDINVLYRSGEVVVYDHDPARKDTGRERLRLCHRLGF